MLRDAPDANVCCQILRETFTQKGKCEDWYRSSKSVNQEEEEEVNEMKKIAVALLEDV